MSRSYQIYIWKKAPFIRLALGLIVGIVLQYYFNFTLSNILFVGFLSLSFIYFFSLLNEAKRYRFQFVRGLFITFVLMAAGAFFVYQKDIRNNPCWYNKNSKDAAVYVLKIEEPVVEKAKSIKAICTVEKVITDSQIIETRGKVLVYFKKSDTAAALQYGDKIIIKKQFVNLTNSGNPYAFDYVTYMSREQIYQQIYLDNNDWRKVGENGAQPFKKLLFSVRSHVINIINKYISGDSEAAVAKALLVGYKVDLDKDLVQAYSNAGVIHLIAISGLHLALIYGLLFFITGKLPFFRNHFQSRIVVIIFCLWFFALLTGASPSVLRAAVMFTFISIGLLSGKRSSIFNSISLSAFILLCSDPFILWNVGFQLSYSAVLGIVICQRSIYNWLLFDKKIPDYAWQLVSVSLAAQVFTIPLCLYYFHQMPLLFVLANLAAIPLCTLAIWSCILLISLSPFAPIAFYAGKMASAFLWLMNESVLSINKIPFSLWKNISFNIYETLLLFIITIGLIRWFFTKKLLTLQLSLFAILSLGFLRGLDQWKAFNQQKIIVYNIPKHSTIDLIKGNYYSSISKEALRPDSLLTAYNINPSRSSFRIFSERKISDSQLKNFIQVNDTKFLLLDSTLKFEPSVPIPLDFIIVSNGAHFKMSDLIQNFSFGQIIFDASNPAWKIRQWKKECEELHLRFHDVSTQGAFVANI